MEQRTAATAATALYAPRCPLCGAANDCAASAGGRLDVACWCRDLTIGPELLARIAPAERGIACICRTCAAAGLAEPARQ